MPRELVDYLADSILDADGADHTRLRKLVSRAFTVRRVAELRPRVEAITPAAAATGSATAGRPHVAEFAYPLPITVICELVGVPEADRPSWREWGAALDHDGPRARPGRGARHGRPRQDLIARRRGSPGDDLITGLVQAQDEDGDQLSEDELVTMVFALVFAGHETTAHLIGNGVLALLTPPRPARRCSARTRPVARRGARADALVRPGPDHPDALRERGRRARRGDDPAGEPCRPCWCRPTATRVSIPSPTGSTSPPARRPRRGARRVRARHPLLPRRRVGPPGG